ncbi:MAG: VOC family protein [Chitinophagaceae bacterium]|nr:VOC family protein [Chitinophagaceae bacterium]
MINWVEIPVNDIDRARSFYEQVFQCQMTALSPPENSAQAVIYTFPMPKENAPYAGGAIVQSPERNPGSGGIMIYFSCNDCSVEESRVAPAGGRVLVSKTSIGHYGFISVIQDTEGNTIGLHSMK